jgi:hypothetical protein
MTSGRWIQLGCVGLAVLCITGSTLLVAPINQRRVDLQIVFNSRTGDGTPPKYAVLAAAMGTFRGLAADFLWYRAEKQKQEGKLFEANTTAQWITTLQPRFGQVWVFQSWNMSYNISVITKTPEERWNWVNKGIELLRDEGIVYNPNNVAIYRQLAWTFFHKIGQRSDDMNRYYKAKLAEQWQELLGSGSEGATTEVALARFKPIADAAEIYFPQETDATEARDPLTRLYEAQPSVVPVVARLREIGYQLDEECLRAIGRIVMFQRYADPRQLAGPGGSFLDERSAVLHQMLNDPQNTEGFINLISFLRAKVLIEDYHMEPPRMYQLMQRFGPMDWRHAASHACYWASVGVEKAGELNEKSKIDVLNTDRQIIHALQMLMHTGDISYNPLTGWIDTVPDPRFIDAYGDAMIEANERQKNIEWLGRGNTDSFESGHENFLLRAVLFSYLYGDQEKAQGYYDQIRELYGQKPENLASGTYTLPLEDLVFIEIRDDWSMADQVGRPVIEMFMVRGFRQGLANARYDIFERYIGLARQYEKRLNEDKDYANAIDPDGQGRLINWVSFEQLLGETYIKYMRSPRYDIFERSQVYLNSPPTFRAVAYPRFRAAVQEQAAAIGFSADQMFPPPPPPTSKEAADGTGSSDQPSGTPDSKDAKDTGGAGGSTLQRN